jgi:hypothetical protein
MPTIILALLARLPALFSLARFSWLIPGAGLFAAVANVFAAIVGFFSTTFGRWVGVALIGLALFVAGDVHRYRADKIKHAAEIARMVRDAEMREQLRDSAIKAAVDKEVSDRVAAIEALNASLQEKVAAYDKTLASAAAIRACRLSRDDVKRLRQL